MICPNCAAPCDDDLRYCDNCGADLSAPASGDHAASEDVPVIQVVEKSAPPVSENPYIAPAPEQPPSPAPKRGRLWPPLVIIAVMICIGTLLFFLIPSGTPEPSVPAASATPWFTVEGGALSFHAELYSGPAELVIPETVNGEAVTAIADYGFSGVESISTVILPETVASIGDYAFSSCKNLRGIYIPSTVRSIGIYAFADCDALEAIYLPGTLEALGHGSLDSCDGLHYILFDGTYAQWTRLYSGYFVSDVELHTIDGTYYAQP